MDLRKILKLFLYLYQNSGIYEINKITVEKGRITAIFEVLYNDPIANTQLTIESNNESLKLVRYMIYVK